MKKTVREVLDGLTEEERYCVSYLVGTKIKETQDITAKEVRRKIRAKLQDLSKVKVLKVGPDYFIMDDSIADVIDEVVEEYIDER